MKHARRIKTVFLLLLAAVIALLGGTAAHMSRRQERYQVAMIVKSTESAFFQSVFAGAGAAATEYNVSLITEGPESEEDYATQNEMIYKAVENGADALVISAVDFNKNAEAVDWAAAKGIPVVVIDSDVNSSAVKFRIGTDNEEAGRMAARTALDGTDGELFIGIVNFDENTANGQQREQGFREEAKKDSRVKEIVTINVPSAIDDTRAATKGLLSTHPEINVITTFNEWTSLGVGWAIRDLNKKDDISVVAFDSNAVSVGMLETGEVDALIVQNPYAMGYLGVEKAWEILSRRGVEGDKLDTETTLVTRENMFLDEYQKILFLFD